MTVSGRHRSGFERVLRALAWAGLVLLLAAYAYLAFRQDSSFFTVSWMPRPVAWWILKYTDYRNFWGFGFLGFYSATFLGAWWWVRRGGHWQWGTLALWLAPVAKELMQTMLHSRHGTWNGAIYGAGGAMLGLLVGTALRSGVQWMAAVLMRGMKGQRKRGTGGKDEGGGGWQEPERTEDRSPRRPNAEI